MPHDNKLIQKFLSSIPIIDLLFICTGKMLKVHPELSYLSKKKLIMAWLEHLLYAIIGFLMGLFFGVPLAMTIYVISFSIGFPIEIYISRRVMLVTWEWARGKSLREVISMFTWAGMNITLYFTIGLALSALA
ncbi:MAG: hypothetical protein QXM73_01735 [Candidatus Nezhaarchaeales archaeon]